MAPLNTWADLIKDAETNGGGNNFEPLPDGDYDFIISEAETKIAQASGNKMFAVRAKVESGPSAGRIVFNNFVVVSENPKALAMFFRNMNVLGLGQDFFGTNPSDDQIVAALTGKRFRGTVGTRTYQDKPKNEITRFATAVGSAPLASSGPAAPSFPPSPTPIPTQAPAPIPQASVPTPAAPPAPPVAATIPPPPVPF